VRADDAVGGSKRGREGVSAGAGRGSGGSRGVRSGKEVADDCEDRQVWTSADNEGYKRELGPERFKTIPLLEMVEEGKATFALDVNGPLFTSPPKMLQPIWSSSLAGQSLSHLLSQMSASAVSGQVPSNWMQGLPSSQASSQPSGSAGLPPPASAFPLSLSPFVGVGGGLSGSGSGSGGAAGGSSSSGSGGGGGSGAAKMAPQTVRGRMTRIGVCVYVCVCVCAGIADIHIAD